MRLHDRYVRRARYYCSHCCDSSCVSRAWNDLPIEIRNSVTFDRFRSTLRTHYYIGMLLTTTVHLDHVTVFAPKVCRSLGDIMERHELFLK